MNNTPLSASLEAIRTAAERMTADANFKVIFEETPGLAEADIAAWQDWLREQPGMENHTIPDELRAIYGVTGGFRFRWQFLPAEAPMAGSAELVDLMSLYQGDEERDASVTALLAEPRPFDIIDQEEFVAARFGRNPSGSVSLVRRQPGSDRVLSLRPIQYLTTMSEFLARYDWQGLYEEGFPAAHNKIDALRREVAALMQKR
jgi:hypothetical protein